ncbi:MAG: tRNA (adenosine(37)-N6)-threonylcarbamoyltransferase complex transferase subunit TsaD [Bacteroidota bacterium]
MRILGIESSCDETAAAVYDDDGLHSNVIASQTIHEQYGGVVPELASRAHHKTISQTVRQALEESGFGIEDIEAIAVTQGPGLIGALLVGVCFAKGLSINHGIPLIGVNHMDAHVYANYIDEQPEYPFVALVVSGGHTQLILVEGPFDHTLLGATRDDAAGEAFDKVGKILGLPYPAGPVMDQLAKQGNPKFQRFPRGMINKGLEFSFSGLKTSVLYHLEDQEDQQAYLETHRADLSASVTAAIVDVLVAKLKRAVKQTGVKTIALAGGVSANSMLRKQVRALASEMKLTLHIPDLAYCTDNAAMIAVTGWMKAQRGEYDDLGLRPFANLAQWERMQAASTS